MLGGVPLATAQLPAPDRQEDGCLDRRVRRSRADCKPQVSRLSRQLSHRWNRNHSSEPYGQAAAEKSTESNGRGLKKPIHYGYAIGDDKHSTHSNSQKQRDRHR